MVEVDWDNAETRCFGLRLAGDAIAEVDSRGNRIIDDTLLILLNAYHEPLRFILPSHPSEVRWQVLLDTREALGRWRYRPMQTGQPYELGARALSLLRLGSDD
jgi:glycogen operon protein